MVPRLLVLIGQTIQSSSEPDVCRLRCSRSPEKESVAYSKLTQGSGSMATEGSVVKIIYLLC